MKSPRPSEPQQDEAAGSSGTSAVPEHDVQRARTVAEGPPEEKSRGLAPNVTLVVPGKPSDANKTESEQHQQQQTVADLLAYLIPRHSSATSMQRFLGIRTSPGPFSPDTVKISVREDKAVQNKKLATRWKKKPPQRIDEEGLQDLLSSLPTMATSSSTVRHSFAASQRRMPPALRDRLHVVLVFVVLCILAVVIGIFLLYSITPTETVCRSDVCNSYSKLLWEMLNVSVKPCDDFYSYVCSNWDSRHSYSFKEDVYLRFIQRVSERNRRTAAPAHGQSASQKAAKFYQSCSATYTQGGDRELDAVKQLLLRFGVLWPRLTNDSNLLRICFAMSATLDWAPVILFSVTRPEVQMTVSPAEFFANILARRRAMLAGGGSDYSTYFGHMLRVFGRPDEPGDDVLTYGELLAMESHLLPALRRAYAVVEGNALENATLEDVIQLAGNTIPKCVYERPWAFTAEKRTTRASGRNSSANGH
ncbi:hypothetical protein HPB49_023605 [Dermacentor silvarum]|uniref:Uncharacterized protein n=1 Tax=Dermacentor silvarum TaxID=543639 RepID=A0ACB8CC09_DERSI|nr:hypothetical protein HPB49_023605 [Dermacentor silvarum]